MPTRDYHAHKERAAVRARNQSSAARDIAPLPPVRDPIRRAKALRSLKFFLETYFPAAFCLAWSAAHLRVIERYERAVLRGQLSAIAMPRGTGKTTMAKGAALWAILTGNHRFIAIIGANSDRGEAILAGVKIELENNDLLLADFPEVCYPIRCLEGVNNRAPGQTYLGKRTRIVWTDARIVLPHIPGSRVAGSIVTATGLEGGNLRGQQITLPSGAVLRPTFVLVDDPQTTESAYSDIQTNRREAILAGDVLLMAGPGHKIAGLLTCTVIRRGDLADRILDRKKHPEWRGERTKMLDAMPERMDLWEQYATLRAQSLEADGDGSEATEFYAAHREDMDRGAAPTWAARYNPDELSATQHAMNLYFQDRAAFASEMQNTPLDDETTDEEPLDAAAIARKLNHRRRLEIPVECETITAAIDCHDKLLYYTVIAWTAGFSGHVVDYGTWPKQPRKDVTMANVTATLRRAYPGKGREGAILAGLVALIDTLTAREYNRTDGTALRLSLGLVDSGWATTTVYDAIRMSGHAAVWMPSKGIGIGPQNKPMAEYRTFPGDRVGWHFRIPSPKGRRETRVVNIDTNAWKNFVHSRLAAAEGDPATLYLWGHEPAEHATWASHITAEYRIQVEAQGRKGYIWKPRSGRPDNHFLDTAVAAAVAAAIRGCAVPGTAAKEVKKKRRVSYKEARARARQGAS